MSAYRTTCVRRDRGTQYRRVADFKVQPRIHVTHVALTIHTPGAAVHHAWGLDSWTVWPFLTDSQEAMYGAIDEEGLSAAEPVKKATLPCISITKHLSYDSLLAVALLHHV